MNAYTSLEQSRKLAEILPLESADMTWEQITQDLTGDFTWEPAMGLNAAITYNLFSFRKGYILPCWSLAALLGVLPSVIKRKNKRMFLTLEKAGAYNLYYKSPDRLDELWETKEELIDACVAMIELLHEQNNYVLRKM